MSLRLSPFRHAQGVSDYTVCVCYRSTHIDKALRLHDGLKHLGLRVLIIAPDEYQQYPNEDKLVQALQQFLGRGDACVVLLDEALHSRWVNVELAEACRIIGRIVFVYDGPSFPAEYQFQDPAQSPANVALVVKHSTIQVAGWDSDSLEHLATQIVNDPEEGIFSSKEEVVAMRDWITRDIKAESEMRKYARRSLIVDPHQPEHLPHLVAAEHRGQPRRRRGSHEAERRPGLVQRLLVQESDRAQRDGGGRPSDLLLVRQVQEVLAQLLLGELRRAGVEMLGELADGGDVAPLGPCGQPAELHILQHPLT